MTDPDLCGICRNPADYYYCSPSYARIFYRCRHHPSDLAHLDWLCLSRQQYTIWKIHQE